MGKLIYYLTTSSCLSNIHRPKLMERWNMGNQPVKDRSSRGHTETLQGNLRLSGTANDDSRRQGLTRTWLKLWCFATWRSLVLNLDGWRFRRFGRFGIDRGEFRRDNLCRFQTEETYMKFWTYKYRREHIRVIGNRHRVGNNNGNRNRTRGMRCKVEQNAMRSGTEWGSGFGVWNGDRGGISTL